MADTAPNVHLTTQERIEIAAEVAAFKVADRISKDFHAVEEQVRRVADAIDKSNGKKRGLWNAIWHGFGIIKAEGDRLFKE